MDPSNSIEPISDPTGSMSQEDINAANISNLIDAVNGLSSSTGNILNQPTFTMVNDGTTNRALFGYNQYTGTWGIFGVPPGTDLSQATQPQQFSLTTDYPSFLSLDSGTTSLAVSFPSYTGGYGNPGTTQSASISVTHNLGFAPIPQVLLTETLVGTVYAPIASGCSYEGFNFATFPGYTQFLYAGTDKFEIDVDSTYLYISYSRTFGVVSGETVPAYNNTFQFQYYLLQLTA